VDHWWNAVCGVGDYVWVTGETHNMANPDVVFVFMGPIYKVQPPARLLSYSKC
jgi:hypothetical protein